MIEDGVAATTERAGETLVPGALVAGRYRIERKLGQGGMGVVYAAVHETLERPVAIKVIPRQLAGHADVIARFFREARAAASIGHPGIVDVFDLGVTPDEGARGGEAPPVAYLVMERLEGEELAERVARVGRLSARRALEIVADVAEAVAAAHERGIVHRDLKPQNVFLARVGRREVVKVLDFGIAKLVEGGPGAAAPITRTGQVFGTPMYMSPEQLRGEPDVDGRSDVYALGVILYELLAGRPPFEDTSYAALVLKISVETPRPLSGVRPDLGEPVLALVDAALAKSPDRRPATAMAFAEALRAVAVTQPADDPPPSAAALVQAQTVPLGELGSGPVARAEDRPTPTSEIRTSRSPRAPSGAGDVAPAPSPTPRRPRVWIAAAAGAIGVAGVVAAGVALRGAPPADGAAPPRAASAVPVEPAAEAPSEAAAPAAPRSGAATVRFSGPEGTAVRVGERRCDVPCALELPAAAAVVVEATRAGHAARTFPLSPPFPPEVAVDPPAAGAPAAADPAATAPPKRPRKGAGGAAPPLLPR